MRLFQLAQIWFGLLLFAQIFLPHLVCKSEWNSSNLPRWFQLYPAVSITHIWLRLFESAQMLLIVCKFNEVLVAYITWIEMKPFEVTQNWMKMFLLTQIWMDLLPFGQSWFSLLEFTQISPIYYTFLILPKFEWSCPNLLKFHRDC